MLVQQIRDLLDLGYTHSPESRTFGGPFAMKSPEGRVVFEKDFQAEIDKILRKE